MSIAFYDFKDKLNRRFFWVVVLCLFLAVVSSAGLIVGRVLEKKALDIQFEKDNDAGKFVAPVGLLDPDAKFKELFNFEDRITKVPYSTLPDAVAPVEILTSEWEPKFTPPHANEIE